MVLTAALIVSVRMLDDQESVNLTTHPFRYERYEEFCPIFYMNMSVSQVYRNISNTGLIRIKQVYQIYSLGFAKYTSK